MPIIQPELLCLFMFLAACGFLIMGYPVAFTLGGTSIMFAFIGAALNVFDLTAADSISAAHLLDHDQRRSGGGAAVRLHGGDAGAVAGGRRAA